MSPIIHSADYVWAVFLNAGDPSCGIWCLKRTLEIGWKKRKRSSVKNSNLTLLHLPFYRPAISMLDFFSSSKKEKKNKKNRSNDCPDASLRYWSSLKSISVKTRKAELDLNVPRGACIMQLLVVGFWWGFNKCVVSFGSLFQDNWL